MKKNRANKSTKKVPACAASGCKAPAVSAGYCRLHYFAHWKEIKEEERTRAERRLNAYVDRLAKRYPADFLEKIKEGIEDENLFKMTMEQLEMDQDEDPETEREFLEKMSRAFKREE